MSSNVDDEDVIAGTVIRRIGLNQDVMFFAKSLSYSCFAQSCTAKHTFFQGKSVMLLLLEGPYKGHTTGE